MKKLILLWNNLNDKVKHFIICFIPTFTLGVYGISGSMGAGITKEWCDSHQPGNKWDWWDIAADVAGAIAGLLAHYGLKYLIYKHF